MQVNTIVVFEYGHCFDRSPLVGLGIIDAVEGEGEGQRVHIAPVYWTVGSPLSKWVRHNSLHIKAVLNAAPENAEAQVFAQAS